MIASASPALSDPFAASGPLFDRDLQLVAPSMELVEHVVRSAHPLLTPGELSASEPARLTRGHLLSFLACTQSGCEAGHAMADAVPTYHFWMRLDPWTSPRIPIAGMINLRISESWETRLHYGHVGYHVYPLARGHHYAERACRLLLPLAARHGLNPLWITCNPDNAPSRRTCERLGAKLVETVDLPAEHPLQARGESRKCRYRMDLA